MEMTPKKRTNFQQNSHQRVENNQENQVPDHQTERPMESSSENSQNLDDNHLSVIEKFFNIKIQAPLESVTPIHVADLEASILSPEKSVTAKTPSKKSRNRRKKRKSKVWTSDKQLLDQSTKNQSSENRQVENHQPCNEQSVVQPIASNLDFSIKAIKSHKNFAFFKTRNKKRQTINLSYSKEKCPYTYETKLKCDKLPSSTNDSNVKRPKENLQNNGTRVNRNRVSVNDRENFQNFKATKQQKQKPQRQEKEQIFYRKYLIHNDVEFGLQSGALIKGVIRINPKNFKEAYVSNLDKSVQDYMIISLLDRNRALEGDVVVLEVKPKSEWRDNNKTARVVYIKEKVHSRTAVGYLSLMPDKNKKFALFSPRDSRLPRMRIPTISWPPHFYVDHEKYKDILFLAKIVEWTNTKYALGSIIEEVGANNDLKVETKAILMEYDLNVSPFPPETYAYVPKSTEIPEKEFSYREDFRKECVFTIDPLTARDLDDAVSCKELPNGNLEIGVHIADVSYYLQEATPLDIIVSKKATTIYLVDNVYHMLPVEMCSLCSLLPGKDCLAFSVMWEMTKDGVILNHRFARTVINSCCQLAYEHAQAIIDDPENFDRDELPEIINTFTPEQICDILLKLNKIAVGFREKRFSGGALRIDQVKLQFRLDPQTGMPAEWSVYENKPSHRLIEEFMLLANITVAKRILSDFPDIAFLRCHEGPNTRMLVDVQRNLSLVGIHIDVDSAAGIHASLNKYSQDRSFLGESRIQVLNHLLAKPMARAKYFCSSLEENYHHYALNVPVYTHFTSPIRRYADIIVHRLLSASLGYTEKPIWGSEFVHYIAENCNKQKNNAKKAGEASSDLFLAHYIENHPPFMETAIVVDVKDRSYDVILIKTGSIIRLYVNNLEEGVKYKVESTDWENKKVFKIIVTFPQTDTLPATNVVIQIFQLLNLEIFRRDKTYKLQAKLLRPIEQATRV